MDENEELDIYSGDTAHDMNVDFDRYMNTGEDVELFGGAEFDDYIDNLYDRE